MTDTAQTLLRPAEAGDAPAIAALFTDEGYPAGPSDIVARLQRFDAPASRVVIAEHEGAILGFIAVALVLLAVGALLTGVRMGRLV